VASTDLDILAALRTPPRGTAIPKGAPKAELQIGLQDFCKIRRRRVAKPPV
jgi:hypothetical protein